MRVGRAHYVNKVHETPVIEGEIRDLPGPMEHLTHVRLRDAFDKALRDPERPTQMLPIYDCGDGLHPSDRGYCHMGDAIDLALFD